MMSQPKICPDQSRLQAMLAGQLAQSEQEEIARHVETCAACQQVLDSLSPASRSWEDLAAQLQKEHAAPPPALRKVIDQAKGVTTENTVALEKSTPQARAPRGEETQAEQQAAPRDEGLGFLNPPTKPGAIGRLAHYDVLEVVGKGGFGIVLKAFDEKLHRMVAIKVLSPAYAANGSARQRFIREAQSAAAVKNEHVVGIYSVQDDAQPPYLVMELIDGIALQDRLDKKGPLSLREILRIGLQTAQGLAAAHKQGLVHRDIKPANILLENGVDRVKITDFGLARAVDDASVTQSGVVAGTPMYMSPEQAEGLPIDHRSDLFSLGSVVYALCTGSAPFRASGTQAVLKRVIDAAPRPIREINSEVPDWLTAIIARLHAKKPAERFQSAAEVADVLGQHLADLQAGRAGGVSPRSEAPAMAGAATSVAHVPGSPRQRRRRWVAALVLFLLVIAIMPVVLFSLGIFGWFFGTSFVGPNPNWPGPPKAAGDKLPAEPFVNLNAGLPGRQPGRSFATLAEAVAEAGSGDTIEIRGNGPFVIDYIYIRRKALTIRAGEGFRPIIQASPEALRESTLVATDERLVLEGLEFQRLGSPPSPTQTGYQPIISSKSPLYLANCRIVVRQSIPISSDGGDVRCQNCIFVGESGMSVSWSFRSGGKLVMDNCTTFMHHLLNLSLRGPEVKDVSVCISRNTVLSGASSIRFAQHATYPNEANNAARLKIEASDSILDGNGIVFRLALGMSLAPTGFLSLPKAEKTVDNHFKWKGAGNLFRPACRYSIQYHDDESQELRDSEGTWAEWKERWGGEDRNALVGKVVYQGGNLGEKLRISPTKVTAEDFRLADSSPGKGAGPGGKDIGADVDLVGPGPAYERWKKTPEYQEWRKKTAQLMAAP